MSAGDRGASISCPLPRAFADKERIVEGAHPMLILRDQAIPGALPTDPHDGGPM